MQLSLYINANTYIHTCKSHFTLTNYMYMQTYINPHVYIYINTTLY